MKSFKQLLQEKSDWEQWVFSGSFYPLSTPMLKRIFKNLPKVTAYHVTSMNYLESLIKIQNTKKSISVFTYAEERLLSQGVETGGGIVVKLKGEILSKGEHDMYSGRDSHGRRWLDTGEEGGNDPDMLAVMTKIRKTFLERVSISRKKFEWDDWYNLKLRFNEGKLNVKNKQELIKAFFDVVEEVSKKHIKTITNFVMGKSRRYHFRSHYDELIMNQFKVLEIYLNEDSDISTRGKIDFEQLQLDYPKIKFIKADSRSIHNEIKKQKK